jgi:hypothetical protein
MKPNKRGEIQGVWGIVGLIAAVGVIALVLGVYIYILFTMNSSMGGDTIANSTKNVSQVLLPAINALTGVAGWLALVVVIAIASIVIVLVMTAFAFVKGKQE